MIWYYANEKYFWIVILCQWEIVPTSVWLLWFYEIILDIDLFDTYDWSIWYLWLVYLIIVIDLLETCDWHTWYTYSLLNCDYWIWIWKLWTVYCELLSWDDFCAGCNLNRFDWYERSTHILASFFLFIMLLVEYRDGLYFVLVSTFV